MSVPRVVEPDRYNDPPRSFRTAEWFSASGDAEGFAHYLAVLRSRIWLIVLIVAVCVAAAALYLVQAPKVYEAQADLLIMPVPRDNTTLIGLGLPRESSDPTRDVETISRLLRAPAVSRRAITQLGLDESPRALLKRISAAPVAQSNIVTITATGSSPEAAEALANAFASAGVAYRTQRLHEQLDVAIPQLRRQIARLPQTEIASRQALLGRLRDLESLRAVSDPTVRLETPAEAGKTPVSPRPTLTMAAAVVAGLLLAAAVALGSQLLDPRLRREEQLRRYRIPVLARIPLERRKGKKRGLPLTPLALSPQTRDAYLLLGATLSGGGRADHGAKRSVLVTGPSPGDGKTTSALNLAIALAESDSVFLVESDSRRPVLAAALGVQPAIGTSTAIARRMELANVVMDAPLHGPRLRTLLQKPSDAGVAAVMTPAASTWLVRQGHQLANWLVVDAPPLSYVPDALSLAQEVDDVVLVVRLGNTRLKELEELAELLAQQGITPAGFVVVGGRDQAVYYGH